MTRAVDSGLTNLCPSLIPDGAIVLTTPSGRSHITTPTGARFFPQLAVPTATLALPNSPPASRITDWPCRPESAPAPKTAPPASNTKRGLNRAATPPTHHPCDF
jgi:hypothetical protein